MVIETPNFELDTSVAEDPLKIEPNALYSSGVCLQRDAVLHIWGTTTETSIAVELNGKMYYGTVADGRFDIYIAPQEAGGPYAMTFYGNTAKRTVRDVYIGEVFLCSGQSNMELWMSQCAEYHYEDIMSADSGQIRLLAVDKNTSETPLENLPDLSWSGTKPDHVSRFSCVAYLFGREMHQRLGVPVGIVTAAWGGSIAAFWMPQSKYEELSAEYDIYTIPGTTEFTPCIGYNAMIAPLRDFAFRSVLWYQGESNGNHTAKFYDKEMEGLIQSWREAMDNEGLGFTIIELPRCKDGMTYWSTIREKQQIVASNDPLVCMSVSIDLGDWSDLHPRDKTLFAKRAAEETLKTFFSVEDIAPYPTVRTIERISDHEVRIWFDGVGEGITVSEFANGFEVSENGNNYTMITSYTCDEESITVTSVGRIAYVRYGYRCIYTNVDYQSDVKLQLSVWNSYGNPLDQFVMPVD